MSHLLVMGTGASEMSGRGGCVAGQVGTPLSHDHSMARLMDTHTHTSMHVGTYRHAKRQTHVPIDRQVNEMKWRA